MLRDLEQCRVTLGHSRSKYVPYREGERRGEGGRGGGERGREREREGGREREREGEEGRERKGERGREREREERGMVGSHGRVYVGGYLISSDLCTLQLYLFSLCKCDIDSSVLRV